MNISTFFNRILNEKIEVNPENLNFQTPNVPLNSLNTFNNLFSLQSTHETVQTAETSHSFGWKNAWCRLALKSSEIDESMLGVFADQNNTSNFKICEYFGKIITTQHDYHSTTELFHYTQSGRISYLQELGSALAIDGEHSYDCIARFVNHSDQHFNVESIIEGNRMFYYLFYQRYH
ncbi:hypothetical protein RCL1_000271 [Eukaryota sp. TZLM3-RCL]